MTTNTETVDGEVSDNVGILPPDAPAPLHELLDRWQAITAERLPTEADFPFDELVGTYPGLGLVEPAVSPEGRLDYCYRRVGPSHQQHTGWAFEGRLFSDLIPARAAERVIQTYIGIFATGEPHYAESINLVHGSQPRTYVRLLLPLFDGEGRVVRLLGCWIWRGEEAG